MTISIHPSRLAGKALRISTAVLLGNTLADCFSAAFLPRGVIFALTAGALTFSSFFRFCFVALVISTTYDPVALGPLLFIFITTSLLLFTLPSYHDQALRRPFFVRCGGASPRSDGPSARIQTRSSVGGSSTSILTP
jgi:hypothetical protein